MATVKYILKLNYQYQLRLVWLQHTFGQPPSPNLPESSCSL